MNASINIPSPSSRSFCYSRRRLCPLQFARLLVFLVILAPVSSLRAQSQVEESRVKAAFLFHFAQLVDWPQESLGAANQPVTFCALGDDPLSGALEATVQGKQIASRSIVVRYPHESDDLSGCHLLYIASRDKKHVADILARLKRAPVLTVGETDTFAQQGGMIGFALQENKIRFDINLLAARRSNLKISSRLLVLAKSVIGDPGQG